MNTLVLIFVGIFGVLIGSFLNVVILRYGTGLGFGGRSRCASSGQCLRWFELIPVISFLIQGGKSRYTGKSLSLQYPFVELLTGVVFTIGAYRFIDLFAISPGMFFVQFIFIAVVFGLGICVFIYDFRHKIIPNEWSYTLAFLGLLSVCVTVLPTGFVFNTVSLGDLLAGPLLALPFALLWIISSGKWIGLGDAKLMLGLGWLLGPSLGLSGLLLGIWIGAVYAIILVLFFRKGRKTEIPFGPFLLIGALLAFLYTIDIGTLISIVSLPVTIFL